MPVRFGLFEKKMKIDNIELKGIYFGQLLKKNCSFNSFQMKNAFIKLQYGIVNK